MTLALVFIDPQPDYTMFYGIVIGSAIIAALFLILDLWLFRRPWRKTAKCPRCRYDFTDRGITRKTDPAGFEPFTCSECGFEVSHPKQAFHLRRRKFWLSLRVAVTVICLFIALSVGWLEYRYWQLNRAIAALTSTGYVTVERTLDYWQAEKPVTYRLNELMNERYDVYIYGGGLSSAAGDQAVLIDKLPAIPCIDSLHLDFWPVNMDRLIALKNWQRLVLSRASVDLSVFDQLGREVALHFDHIDDVRGQCASPFVNELYLEQCHTDLLANLYFPNLKWLTLERTGLPGVSLLMKYPSLDSLRLKNVEVEDSVLRLNHPGLSHLWLDCTFEKVTLSQLHCPNLKSLEIVNSKMPYADMGIESLTGLEAISLSYYTGTQDGDVAWLKPLKHLRWLTLLTSDGLGGATILNLGELDQVSTLMTHASADKLDGLDEMADLKYLALSLDNAPIARAALDKLKAARPDLTIDSYWDSTEGLYIQLP